MDYEKKYKEALTYVKDLIEHNIISKENAGKYIPELKESEDEKIRKTLIRFHKSTIDIDGIKGGDILAWLEKQDEKKPVQEIEPTPIFRIGDTLKRKDKDYTFRVDRIQGGYYHCDCNYGAFFPIEEQGNWELVEQNTVKWGEEDKKALDDIIEEYETRLCYAESELAKDYLSAPFNWLKSLKQRIGG